MLGVTSLAQLGCPSHRDEPAVNAAPSASAAVASASSSAKPAPSDSAPIVETEITVAELKKHRPGKDHFIVDAYVVSLDLSACPACPPDADCPPCTKFRVVVSDAPKTLAAGEDPGAADIALAGSRDDVKRVELGHRYRFHVTLWRRSMSLPPMARVSSVEIP